MNSIVDHIAVLVNDLEKSSEWYISCLGAVITHKQPNYYRLKLQNVNIALLDRSISTSKPHIGVLCEKINDLPEFGERIVHRDGTTGVYVQDLDGNNLEFIYYGLKSHKFIK
jgi:catechol-2,3-dioxygenase